MLTLKEFILKKKDLVNEVVKTTLDKKIYKKSETKVYLKENWNKFRNNFSQNIHSLSNKYNIMDFKNYLSNHIFVETKELIDKTSHENNDNYHLTDYSTALYGASIVESLTSETQPISSKYSMIEMLHIINNPPIYVLENTIHPNSCWAMKGKLFNLFIY